MPVVFPFNRYEPFGAYSHSKLGNIWHASELSRRLKVSYQYECFQISMLAVDLRWILKTIYDLRIGEIFQYFYPSLDS